MAKKPFSQEEIQDIKEYKQYLDDTITRYKSLQEELKKYNKYVASNAREAVKAQLREITEQLGTYKEITSELKKYQSLVNKIEQQEEKIKNQTKERADDTETIVENLKEQNKELEEQAKKIKSLGDDWNEIDDLQTSISSNYGKQYGDVGAIQKKIDGTKAIVGSISELIKSDSKSYGDQLDKILEISERYKQFPAEFARMNKERKRGNLTEKGMIDQLRDSLDEFDEMISKIQVTNEETGKLVDLFKQLRDEQAAFNDAQKRGYELKQTASALITESPFGNAPVVGGAISKGTDALFSSETLKSATLVTVGYLAAKALGAVASIENAFKGTDQDIANTFKGRERYYDAVIKQTEMLIQAQEKITERAGGFTERLAQFDFDTELGKMIIDFDKVSKTAFFGSGIGSVKYAKDELALAGINAQTIVSTMTEMSTGANNAMQGLAEDASVFSAKTGIATSELSTLTNMFRMLDKSKGVDAFNKLQENLSNFKFEGVNPADIASEMASAGELALQYNIASSEELVKQVGSLKEMGVSWSKISDAGKGMVLNYKDSIRKEMQLSALLGENVDLSEVRALFAAGRNAEAFSVLKSSGIMEKAQSAGLFGTELLSGATMGMPLQQIAAQQYEKGTKGTGIISNQEFLSAKKEAERVGRIDAANFEVDRAIIRLTDSTLEQGLAFAVGTNTEITRLELAKMGTEIQKFIDVEFSTLYDAITSPVQTFKGMSRLVAPRTDYGMMGTNLFPGGYGTPAQRTFNVPESILKNANLPNSKQKLELIEPTAMVKPLESADKSLKKIDLASTTQARLLENIQTLTAATSKLTDPSLGIKLMIDGKDVKSRIEKIQAQEKGKMRV